MKSRSPSDWEVLPLGEVVNPSRPRIKPSEKPELPFIGMEHIEAHTMKLLGTVPADTMKSSAVHFQPGDVLYGRLRPYLNKVYRPDFEGLCSAEFIVFPKTERVDSRYLQYFLNSSTFASFASHLNTGDRPRVDFEQLSPYTFPVAPLEQQKLIVAEIEKQFSRLDEAVANLKRIKANLKRYKAAVLKAAVEGKLTENWRKKIPDVEPASKLLERILTERRAKKVNQAERKNIGSTRISSGELEELPNLPTNWAYLRLGELISEPKYGTSRKCDYKTEGIGVLRIPNVVNGFIDATDLKFAEFDKNEIETYRLKEGDILIIRSNGSVALVGKCALVTKLDEKYLYAGYLIRIRPFPEILSKYLMMCFPSLLLRTQIEAKAKSTSGVNNINSGELKSLIFPICSKEEQNEVQNQVERRLSFIERLEAAVDANLTRAVRLRQSVLEKAFSGRLVPEDPNAELASALLSRPNDENRVAVDKTTPGQKKTFVIREKEAMMADLIEALRSSGGWLAAQEAFRLHGIADGADTNEVERVYAELRECIHLGQIEVERRGEQDWLRLVENKGG